MGELGVERVVIAADIAKKSKFIRENISAWLRRPYLGMAPLFRPGKYL